MEKFKDVKPVKDEQNIIKQKLAELIGKNGIRKVKKYIVNPIKNVYNNPETKETINVLKIRTKNKIDKNGKNHGK